MRYKLTIEYDGTRYCGFQKQNDQPDRSIEELLEKAVFSLTNEKVEITVCGRTDAGVHALGQVIHFDLEKEFDTFKILSGVNHFLMEQDIVVLSSEIVDENFHSRLSAKMRHYRYVIINRIAPLAIEKKRAWHVVRKLDTQAMRLAAKDLIGLHDFSSFRDRQCTASSAMRRISNIEIKEFGEEIYIEVSAKSFLHHMVRNIVGTLVFIGIGKEKAENMKNILSAKDRTKSGPNAPACGLYFMKVDY
ncbi:MAG: tRNA pseudouridine(38-40) synthase TruA [Rickettsiales bacterium]|nr:tRNA pseudouridine(38-40) synthase TruA [Rickettsiales bacterium]